MVRPRRVVSGLGATPKRRSAGLVMARCLEPKSEVGADARVRFKVRGSGVGFAGGKFCLTVSVLWVMLDNGSPLSGGMEMDESRIDMKESWMGPEAVETAGWPSRHATPG